ncbi:MAG TPA: NHL repeat-containing protein, partial [Solirubrobacterales bacterium]|nr:NHL repeat-containing protein [Solirubrobacterales bacterium]
ITSAGGVPLKEVRGLTVAPNGSIFLAEKGNRRIIKFDSAGQFVSAFTPGLGATPFDVGVSADGTLWMTDPDTKLIYRYSETGTLKSFFAVPQPYGGVALPFGIDVDEFGNGWVALQGSNQIMEFSPSGTQLFTFGTTGSGSGQFNSPFDVAIAPSGNLFVSDSLNHRIQEFKPDGGFMRTFGTSGAAPNQLNTPKNIAVAPGNKLVVADFNNKRIARWEHADRHVESGATKTEVKVDEVLKDTYNPGCAAGKNCSISREWVMKADEYSVGTHKVEVISTDGVGLATTKTLNVETHGDRTAPTIALTGSITEQATLGKTLPTYKVKTTATDPGPNEERKSGVASVAIIVDGKTVDSASPGCPAEGCSLTREWTLNSSSYSVGFHRVEVVATDAAGKSKTASREFEIKRDTTAPEMVLSGALPGAPEGWVQQGTRSATAEATDQGGYGVKQIRFSIDGVVVGESLTQTCEAGSCSKAKTFWINMDAYGGGSHSAVMAAEDLAGNVRNRSWTINVDPEGHISASEAADTLEAVEQTADASIITPSTAEETVLPFDPPGMKAGGGGFASVGAPVETTVSLQPGATTTIHTDEGPISIEPTAVGSGATEGALQNEAAALSSNTSGNVDTIVHPKFDGTMMFQAIRDSTSSETFSWRFSLNPEQEIEAVGDQALQVWWKGEPRHPAVLISVIAAHDAIGTAVPTSLALTSSNVVTLTVHHHSASYVYPVVAGTGWDGGFETTYVESPPGEAGPNEGIVNEIEEPAPEAATASEAEVGEPLASASKDRIEHKHFRWIQCHIISDEIGDAGPFAPKRPGGHCGNPFAGEEGAEDVAFSYGIRGDYYRVLGEWAKHKGAPTDHIECAKKNNVENQNTVAIAEWDYFIDPHQKCVWWGKTKYGGGAFVEHGEHLSPYGEWNWGFGRNETHEWTVRQVGLALYIWATKSGYVGHHNTTCIDC